MKVVPLRYDVAFKKAFGQREVFNAFVQDVLGIEFESTEVHREYSYHEPIGRVKLKYDLFAEDKERRIIVGFQHVQEPDQLDPSLYYHLIGLAEQIQSYEDDKFDKTVYTIVLLTSLPKQKHKAFGMMNVSFDARDEQDNAHPLYPHRLVFLNPHLLSDHIPPAVSEWLKAVLDSLDGEVEPSTYAGTPIQLALQAVQEQELTPEELAIVKDEAAWQRAKRESREEGIEEGLQKGREEGIEEGLQKGQQELLQKFLAGGMTLEQIAEFTGMSIEEVQQVIASGD
jgi:predicted transposase/invertase (TIGR01784 family)